MKVLNKISNFSGRYFGSKFKLPVDLFVFDLKVHQLESVGKNKEQSKYRTDTKALQGTQQDGQQKMDSTGSKLGERQS